MDEHPTVEDFARFLQESPRTGDSERNSLVVRHLLAECAVCRVTLQEVRGQPGLLRRLLDLPLRGDEVHSASLNYEWVFARAERALNAVLRTGPPPERLPENLAELAGIPEGEQVRRVSGEGRFANPEFIHCVVERSHSSRYRSPRKTLHWAYLARIAAELCNPEAAGGEAQLADLRAQAWGQYGNALRISGLPREAEKALETAQRYRETGTGDPRLHAWLFERLAPLAMRQNRFEDAIRICEEAGTIYLDLGEHHLFARTLVQKAIAALDSGEVKCAIDTLHQAIPLIDSEEDPYLFLAAHHNLARSYIDFNRPEEALALHHEARSLYREFKDPLILLRATWQEGILLREIGHLQNAEAALIRARRGYIEQGLAYEMALVSLDLVEVCSRLGKTEEVQRVIAEAAPIFRAMRVSREVLALRLLQQASGVSHPVGDSM